MKKSGIAAVWALSIMPFVLGGEMVASGDNLAFILGIMLIAPFVILSYKLNNDNEGKEAKEETCKA